MIEQIKAWTGLNFWKKQDHATASRGAQDALRPVALNSSGKLDNTMLNAPIGAYHAGAPSATGYITIVVSGVTYKILVST